MCEHGATHWNTDNLPGVTALKNTDTPNSSTAKGRINSVFHPSFPFPFQFDFPSSIFILISASLSTLSPVFQAISSLECTIKGFLCVVTGAGDNVSAWEICSFVSSNNALYFSVGSHQLPPHTHTLKF